MDEEKSLADQLSTLVRSFTERRVLVVGDLIADQFLYGEISRVSREAPVLILRHERTETVPGGAANCVANLASLGARAEIIGALGDDEPGRALLHKLTAAGVASGGVIVSPKLKTTTKARILAGHAHSSRQQVIRLDYEGGALEDAGLRAALVESLRARINGADAVIVSDYNYGVACVEMLDLLRDAARAGKPVLIDSRFRLTEFRGFTAATPNEDEVEQVLHERLPDAESLASAGEKLRARLDLTALLVTRGRNGMLLFEEGQPPFPLAAVGERDAVDVTGAGDTVIATFALALASGAGFADAARLANHAGGAVVMKRGTASVTPHELLASLREHEI